jgi:hypothetical protein
MLTELVKGVNQSFWEFVFSGSRNVNLPITISVQRRKGEAIWNLETGKLVSGEMMPTIKTNTLRISKDAISFIVPNIRFNDANLAGEGRVLNIEIEFPGGKVKLEAVGEYYERIGKRTSLASYLIEAKIVYINPLDEEVFKKYLRGSERKTAAQREKLVFGITER